MRTREPTACAQHHRCHRRRSSSDSDTMGTGGCAEALRAVFRVVQKVAQAFTVEFPEEERARKYREQLHRDMAEKIVEANDKINCALDCVLQLAEEMGESHKLVDSAAFVYEFLRKLLTKTQSIKATCSGNAHWENSGLRFAYNKARKALDAIIALASYFLITIGANVPKAKHMTENFNDLDATVQLERRNIIDFLGESTLQDFDEAREHLEKCVTDMNARDASSGNAQEYDCQGKSDESRNNQHDIAAPPVILFY